MCCRKRSKSNSASAVKGFFTYEYRFTAISRQLSYGHNGISPQGFVDIVLNPKSA